MGTGRIEYPAFILDACTLVEDRRKLINGDKKTTDSILVKCVSCGKEYSVKIMDVYKRKVNPDSFIKPLLCRSCVRKNKQYSDLDSCTEESSMEEDVVGMLSNNEDDIVTNCTLDKEESDILDKEESDGLDKEGDPALNKSTVGEHPKGVDIYVENDINDLDRMLGIAPDPVDDSTDDDSEEVHEGGIYVDNLQNDLVSEKPEEVTDVAARGEESTVVVSETPIKKDELVEHLNVCLSDFMIEDKDSFTYLCVTTPGYYQVRSIPITDKKEIRQAVKSSNYIFRYPKFTLKDRVLGYSSEKIFKAISYEVFFPEYSLYFEVGEEYEKPFSESFEEYFEDLITRVRPRNMNLRYYEGAITIVSLKVLEIGLLEVITSNKETKKLLLKTECVSFNGLLDYIREVSDMGAESIRLPILSRCFKEVV